MEVKEVKTKMFLVHGMPGGIHGELKSECAINNIRMNDKIIQIIKEYLANRNSTKGKQNVK